MNARQTVGSIHQRYRGQLETVSTAEEFLAVEKYFSVTALAHALRTAELGMQAAAAAELETTYQLSSVRRISTEVTLASPERFLTPAYGTVKTAEPVDWLDFAHGTQHRIDWIDTLREQSAGFRLLRFGVGTTDRLGTELVRKFCARDRILQGLCPSTPILPNMTCCRASSRNSRVGSALTWKLTAVTYSFP